MGKPTLEQVLHGISWWQKWEIEPGVFTPGPHDVNFLIENLQLPDSLEGKRVLDIGGWNGAFSFECERRNALEVVMIEPTPSSSTGFDVTKEYLNSNVKLYPASIYNLDPSWIGHFDIVLFFGVIYHLRYPLLGLDNIRRVCRGDLYVESACLDTACWTENGLFKLEEISPTVANLPMLQFFSKDQYFNDTTNWFVPNLAATNAMLNAAGFEVIVSHINGRYFARARVMPGEAPMFSASHEGIDYDTHCYNLLGPRDRWLCI